MPRDTRAVCGDAAFGDTVFPRSRNGRADAARGRPTVLVALADRDHVCELDLREDHSAGTDCRSMSGRIGFRETEINRRDAWGGPMPRRAFKKAGGAASAKPRGRGGSDVLAIGFTFGQHGDRLRKSLYGKLRARGSSGIALATYAAVQRRAAPGRLRAA